MKGLEKLNDLTTSHYFKATNRHDNAVAQILFRDMRLNNFERLLSKPPPPQAPAAEPEASETEPEASAAKPEASAAEPEASAKEWQAPAAEPHSQSALSKTSLQRLPPVRALPANRHSQTAEPTHEQHTPPELSITSTSVPKTTPSQHPATEQHAAHSAEIPQAPSASRSTLLKRHLINLKSMGCKFEQIKTYINLNRQQFIEKSNQIKSHQQFCQLAHHVTVDYNLIEILSNSRVVETTADGNCLYNAISISVFGHECHSGYIKMLTAFIIIENPDYFNKALSYLNPNLQLSKLIEDTVKHKIWGREIHYIALSILFSRPVYVYCFNNASYHIDCNPIFSQSNPIFIAFNHNHYMGILETGSSISYLKPKYNLVLDLPFIN